MDGQPRGITNFGKKFHHMIVGKCGLELEDGEVRILAISLTLELSLRYLKDIRLWMTKSRQE